MSDFSDMDIKIIDEKLVMDIYGFSAVAMNHDHYGTAFRLMDKMWKVIKTLGLKNKGLNVWVYEPGDRVFAGVELEEAPPHHTELEHKLIKLPKYAYYKHIGPYGLIQQAGQTMRAQLLSKGAETQLPYIEIYGHWTNDETKLETELLMSLK